MVRENFPAFDSLVRTASNCPSAKSSIAFAVSTVFSDGRIRSASDATRSPLRELKLDLHSAAS